ncbi:hypothetical protein IMG5_129680 [Ichthyophthirius multifiliis]|uniref:ODAD1 central coiled coil region domain-containing protein n=1 Tax=Ichthyophthirius multifiliis TaxID=5932 RepID=G0QW68_ICHMU|nr:hypothetical protein IMG5_129680 [Ichthyophthirius multifiliis]EGR30549.1 hypothetical protein IMG5_129680 [Ichthyophthirius multifiliis]|eukprot:XP_004032136.1 hypothetical protein IMG5_129680 [Ichthyophthirius multifiliis]
MYTGYEPSHNQSQRNMNLTLATNEKSILQEPIIVSMQKEVDNYTRKLEQEKRRLFGLDETYNIVLKEYKQKIQSIKELKQKSHNTETKLMESQIKNQQAKIEKVLGKHNETQSANQDLQEQINQLRKERVLHLEVCKKLEEDIIRISPKKADENKPKFEILKTTNKKENFDTQDTQNLLKHRLKKIIANNKEKVKIIDQYQKNLKVIEEAFNQIKECSGITDIEEIANTFIKSEEQNYSLYNYVDILSQDIDNLETLNTDLEKKCEDQENDNEARRRALQGTPHDEKIKKKINNLLSKKQTEIDTARNIIKDLKPTLQTLLIDLAQTSFNPDSKRKFEYELGFDLSEGNLENYLADVEFYSNILLSYKSQENGDLSQFLLIDQIPPKNNSTNQNTVVQEPNNIDEYFNLDSKDKELYQHEKLRELAIEAFEQRKMKGQN